MRIYQNLLIVLFILFQGISFAEEIDQSKLKVYTVDEFIKHNTKDSCFVLIDKYIYDVTKFLNDHPGSFKVLFKCCGKDCTKGYADKGINEAHTKKAHGMKDKMIVGILKEKM
jgi:cytochrome b5